MKRFITFITVLVLALLTMAQAPQKMNFQALVRDASNELVKNKQVTVMVSVTNASNVAVYSETQTVTTNGNGVATMVIGEGTPTKGTFSAIDWANGSYFLQTSIDLGGGASALSSISPLLSVPYALYAEKANVDLSNYATKDEIPTDYVTSSALNDYAKKSDVDLSGYYSKAEIDALLENLKAEIGNGGGGGSSQQGSVAVENGAIKAAFSISDSKQIYFSQGNLQYQASTGTWRFAEHQYDIIGDDNANISSTNSGWIDLFGWGTSGWNSGANAYQPYSTSTDYEDYYLGGSYSNNLTGSYANADWGVYNAISNGGNQAGQWRTLTQSEWNYVISNRTDARYLRGTANVNGVNGLVLLPDNWTFPSDVEFTYGEDGWQNTYSASEWSKMEANGAVFLPAAGYRYGTDVDYVGSGGYYWSSSANDGGNASYLNFYGYYVSTGSSGRSNGQSVRLVRGL